MANGDTAAALGWNTFASTQSISQGYDDINYALDRAADQANRLTVVEAAVNQPIFSVQQGSSTTGFTYGTWTQVTPAAWGTPRLNTGFTSFTGGQLKIAKAGVYRVAAHLQLDPGSSSFASVAAQIVKNTTSADTASTIAKDERIGGPGASPHELAPLVAGDVITLLAFHRATDGQTKNLVPGVYNLSLSLEWVRS